MTSNTVGILHPGEMGASIGAAIASAGHRVLWASEGRSEQSRTRAERASLESVESFAELARRCTYLVSVCPPDAAEEVARKAAGAGFRGGYLDANAISPERAKRIGTMLDAAGAAFVDGSIIGPPASRPGTTRLYLSGRGAADAAALFAGSSVETRIAGEAIGDASAVKMCFSAYSKGTTALLAAILSAADRLGVSQALRYEWSKDGGSFANEADERVRQVTRKAWRFAGEMEEISATFGATGLPEGFHAAAAELYRRLAPFKGSEAPELADVLASCRST